MKNSFKKHPARFAAKFASIACLTALAIFFSACSTVNHTANVSGAADYTTVAAKDFITLGIITVRSQEIHHSGPFGITRKVEGSKITFADLMQEAAKLEADDIINVRIDRNVNFSRSAFSWLTGWKKIFSYTGTALAIRYTDRLETQPGDPQFSGLPRNPESTRAVRTTRSGEIRFR